MTAPTVEIITIGDELLFGHLIDTNAPRLSRPLDELGFDVRFRTTVGDRPDDLPAVLKHATARADVVLLTGGLGPTSDDLTKPLLADFFNAELVHNDEAAAHLDARMAQRRRQPTARERGYVLHPE
ncbi:MAG: molybdopterin-binding protein, partial [Catalinimonas sp.]